VSNKNERSWLLAIIALLVTQSIYAAEGGSSSYFQGSYGDFATGVLGPQGIYFRNDAVYYDAKVSFNTLGRAVDGYVAQVVWGDLLKFAYISDRRILGGRYNAAVLIPVLVGSRVTRHVTGRAPTVAANSDITGLGDIYLIPAALGWNWGDHHLNASMGIIVPTGDYESSRAINEGRHYWSVDPTLNYTWLHSRRGHELTLTLGYMKNGENTDENYTTGDELHLDWTLAHHFSAKLGVGITGYWYEQVTRDSGDLPPGYSASDFEASSFGIGPAVLYTPTIAGHHVSVIAKWISDTSASKRLEGDVFFVSFALKL